MKKIQLVKKSVYLMVTVATFLPVMILSAREGRGGEQNRNMGGSTRSHETNQNHEKAAYEHHTSPYSQPDEHHMNPYEGAGGYVAPVAAPDPQSQPGMSDDSSPLYNSYIHSNPPQR